MGSVWTVRVLQEKSLFSVVEDRVVSWHHLFIVIYVRITPIGKFTFCKFTLIGKVDFFYNLLLERSDIIVNENFTAYIKPKEQWPCNIQVWCLCPNWSPVRLPSPHHCSVSSGELAAASVLAAGSLYLYTSDLGTTPQPDLGTYTFTYIGFRQNRLRYYMINGTKVHQWFYKRMVQQWKQD